jgi:uncharacterized protein DUF1360
MSVPDWWAFLLLGLAAWSTFELLAFDTILEGPRRRLLRLGREWEKAGDPVPDNYRLSWAIFLSCPYCAGFWIAVAWLAAWEIDHKWTLIVAAFMALRALVISGDKLLRPEDSR